MGLDCRCPKAGGPHRHDRLKCLVWAGTGVLWTMSSGVPRSQLIGAPEAAAPGRAKSGAGC